MSAPAAAPAAVAAAGAVDAKPSYRRDLLVEIEQKVQSRWESAKIWESDSKDAATRKPEDKFFASFPYPYMNGVLHLGHGFTLAKVDFECQYQRLKGKNVLFPFGFHCTGMPICAAADRLKREIKQFGDPSKPEATPAFPQPAPEKLIEAVQINEAKEGDKKEEKKKGQQKERTQTNKTNKSSQTWL